MDVRGRGHPLHLCRGNADLFWPKERYSHVAGGHVAQLHALHGHIF